MQKSGRLIFIDNMKYICIMMVMLSHLESNTDFWRTFYSPFFLMGFFFASGYVYRHRPGFGSFLYKKVRQLLIPWFVFSNLTILASHIISFNQHESLAKELLFNLLQIRGYYDSVWFVAAIFVASIPFYFAVKTYESLYEKKKERAAVPVLICSFILSLASLLYCTLMPGSYFPWGSCSLPWHLEYMFHAMFFMLLGYVAKRQHIISEEGNVLRTLVSMAIYLAVVFATASYKSSFPVAVSIPYQYLTNFLGIFAVFEASKLIPYNRYISYVGRNTLIYFAFHGKVYSILETLIRKLAGPIYTQIMSNPINSSLFALILTFIMSLVLIIPAYIINRWFPFIIGRDKVSKTQSGGRS